MINALFFKSKKPVLKFPEKKEIVPEESNTRGMNKSNFFQRREGKKNALAKMKTLTPTPLHLSKKELEAWFSDFYSK